MKPAYITISHDQHTYTATAINIQSIVYYLQSHVDQGKLAIVQNIEGGDNELRMALEKFSEMRGLNF
mgnify:CR=1 FL=1|tara:strand:- start:120 stop:320 length:201 start_codon:yes stop_codon:yes gene_type:complete